MFELIHRNRRRSALLVVAMTLLLVVVGFFAGELLGSGGGPLGILLALAAMGGLFAVSWFAGDKVLLAASKARPVDGASAPQLVNVVEEMSIAAGLAKPPRVYVIESNAPNAFATGRDPEHATVAITDRLLSMLSREELQAVIAHEIGHIKHRDILYMTLLSVMAGSIALLSDVLMRWFWWGGGRRRSRTSSDSGQAELALLVVGFLVVVFGALVARLIYLAASRTREYMADAGAAVFTRNPLALASALEKLGGEQQRAAAGGQAATPVPPSAQAMLIVSPALKAAGKKRSSRPSLFATHPPLDQRIEILRLIGGQPSFSYGDYAGAFDRVTGKRASFFPGTALDEVPVETMAWAPAEDGALAEGGKGGAGGRAGGECSGAELRREALDSLRRDAGWRLYDCPCGARLKLPGELAGERSVACPRCGQVAGA
ncbi:MAG: peptidase M28 [Planctomycetes bacterium]|nr:peptidase M28 [Planctomycetota bacterium]HJO26776.1 M48 family metallopeptidase [Planctomycetota bacterium]